MFTVLLYNIQCDWSSQFCQDEYDDNDDDDDDAVESETTGRLTRLWRATGVKFTLLTQGRRPVWPKTVCEKKCENFRSSTDYSQ